MRESIDVNGFFSFLLPLFSIVGGFFQVSDEAIYRALPSLPHVPKREVHILFGGDVMFDRSIRTAVNENGGDFIFSCIDPLLHSADLVVANLEGPVTSNDSKSVGSSVGGEGNYTFTFPPSTAALLYDHNIRMVNIGNNHITNFSRSGVEQTTRFLDDAHVEYFGDPINQSVASTTLNGLSFAFINYNQFERSSSASTTISQILKAKSEKKIVVIYTHWGTEYISATDDERSLAHAFVDSGADIVIGSHPHVVQENELYKGSYIYYSLGNFIFDQYWNSSVRTGLLLDVTFSDSHDIRVKEIPVFLGRDRRTCVMGERS